VRNGCKVRDSREVIETEALDCVHEMDTINHYVGMYPIASGGPVEKAFSGFLFAFMGAMLVGFVLPQGRVRTIGLGLGFAAVAGWMVTAIYTPGGVQWQTDGYVRSMLTSLGQAEKAEEDENLHPVVRQLKASLAASGIGTPQPKKLGAAATKEEMVAVLRSAFETDQARKPPAEREAWTGSGLQAFAWHYDASLNRWFNEPAKNAVLVRTMVTVAHLLAAAVIVAMLVLLIGARRDRGPFFWALIVLPMLLPAGFIAEYAAWLWWYGHSLNAMGAFTLKPFMPTVLGDGKVAQFSTHSYPHIGFGFMVASSVLLAIAALLRRKALKTGALPAVATPTARATGLAAAE
jgi:hypothetical protein